MFKKLGIYVPLVTATTLLFNAPAQAQYNNRGHFTLGVEAVYWETNFPADIYALAFNPTITSVTNSGSPRHVEGDDDWGYRINLGYLFPCTNNTINLKYTHFDSESSDQSESFTFIDPLNIAPFLTDAQAFGRLHVRHDAVALQVGHQFCNCGFNVNVFTGLEYARFDNSLHSRIQGTLIIDTITNQLDQNFDFNGIGPEMGIKSDYLWNSGFGITGSLVTSLLVGHPHTDLRFTEFNETTELNILDQRRSTDKENFVCPHFDATVGLSYQFCFNCNRSAARIEAGYEVNHYFNITPTITEDAGNEKYYDVSFNGPYVKLQVTI